MPINITKEVETLKDRVTHLEKILILGDGERLPLAEIVRNLTKTVDNYIAQKDKEEQERRAQWDKLKWVIIGFVVPGTFIFIGQAFVFFFRFLPIVESLAP